MLKRRCVHVRECGDGGGGGVVGARGVIDTVRTEMLTQHGRVMLGRMEEGGKRNRNRCWHCHMQPDNMHLHVSADNDSLLEAAQRREPDQCIEEGKKAMGTV